MIQNNHAKPLLLGILNGLFNVNPINDIIFIMKIKNIKLVAAQAIK